MSPERMCRHLTVSRVQLRSSRCNQLPHLHGNQCEDRAGMVSSRQQKHETRWRDLAQLVRILQHNSCQQGSGSSSDHVHLSCSADCFDCMLLRLFWPLLNIHHASTDCMSAPAAGHAASACSDPHLVPCLATLLHQRACSQYMHKLTLTCACRVVRRGADLPRAPVAQGHAHCRRLHALSSNRVLLPACRGTWRGAEQPSGDGRCGGPSWCPFPTTASRDGRP